VESYGLIGYLLCFHISAAPIRQMVV